MWSQKEDPMGISAVMQLIVKLVAEQAADRTELKSHVDTCNARHHGLNLRMDKQDGQLRWILGVAASILASVLGALVLIVLEGAHH